MSKIVRFRAMLAAGLIGLASLSTLADVLTLTATPSSVFGTDPSTGNGTVDSRIVPFGRTVTLTSSNPSVASVPATASVAALRTTFSFTIATYPVSTSTNVTITATEDGVARQTVLTVLPPQLVSVTFTPDPVVGGYSAVATITTNRPVAANWLCSIQGPFPPVYFMTGSIVSFAPGATSTTKPINTQAVNSPVNALITIRPPTGQSPSVSNILQVVPIRAETLTIDPPSVTAGAATLACVTLNAPAPSGGANVALASSDTAIASVQAALLIAAGDSDGCFLVQSHAGPGCAAADISATYGGQTVQAALNVGENQQLTSNSTGDRWSRRNSANVGGKLLWTDGADVLFDDGASATTVQALGTLGNVEDTVFALGSGATPGSVIGVWRRGTDDAWVWRSGFAPTLVNAVNPIDATQPLNPSSLAVSDGAVFLGMQAFSNAQSVKHVFRVDPVSGSATNLTGNAPVPGASRITTSAGQAAWVFDDNTGTPKLHLYRNNAVATVDSGPISAISLRLRGGWLVYQKRVGGVEHIYLLDTITPGATPTRISPDVPATRGHFLPATDGRHVAWLTGDANGTNLDVMLLGGPQLSDAGSRPAMLVNEEHALQLHRGQAMWRDTNTGLRYYADGAIENLCFTPAGTATAPWLADGFVGWYGPVSGSTQTDNEIFLHVGVTPNDALSPPPPMKVAATAGDRGATLIWDTVLGVSSYNVYLATQPGVSPSNYASLPGGRRIAGASSPLLVSNLLNGTPYYFVVTCVEGAGEGGPSMEASATPAPAWTQAATGSYYALSADASRRTVAYAAGFDTLYKTANGGQTWTALGGAQVGQAIRGLAVDGDRVFGATSDGNVLRSLNGGASWTLVSDGLGYGEQNASIAIDPTNPQTIYAGDIQIAASPASLLVKSTDGGGSWTQLSASAANIHAYAMAFNSSGDLYVAGTGIPVSKSTDDGATWTPLDPGISLLRALAIDPFNANVLYVGGQVNSPAGTHGVYKTIDAGANWLPANAGLPQASVHSIMSDPHRANRVYAGTDVGVYESRDGGANWSALSVGMGAQYVYALAMTPARRLLAASNAGLFVLDLSCPGDVDGDGAVSEPDLGLLLAHWLLDAGGDLDGDGDTDEADLGLLLANWGQTCN
ncbi:MAG: hypothetical protein U1D55_19245 [Phycisphaerae bacterium]